MSRVPHGKMPKMKVSAPKMPKGKLPKPRLRARHLSTIGRTAYDTGAQPGGAAFTPPDSGENGMPAFPTAPAMGQDSSAGPPMPMGG